MVVMRKVGPASVVRLRKVGPASVAETRKLGTVSVAEMRKLGMPLLPRREHWDRLRDEKTWGLDGTSGKGRSPDGTGSSTEQKLANRGTGVHRKLHKRKKTQPST